MNRNLSVTRGALASVLVLVLALGTVVPAFAGDQATEKLDLQTISRIRQEGFRNSKIMETMQDLNDRIGPRLTGSANQKRANEWARDLLTQWGLQNAHIESFPFGRGWHAESVMVRMTAPDIAQFYAIAKGWTPGTNGMVTGNPIHLKASTKEDLEKAKGTLGGKIVLISDVRDIKLETEAPTKRYDDKTLADLADYQIPGERLSDPTGRVFSREDIMRRYQFQRDLQKFVADEKPAVVIEASRGSEGLIFVGGSQAYKQGEPDGIPWLYMEAEHYNRVARLVDRKVPVQMEVEVKAAFEQGDGNSWNTIAEIPGTDKKDEIVMVGGHIDSWHAGTGATDDAIGVGVAMEALRILQAIGVKPRRTIRVGLWGGEEQGLLGSRAYVSDHLGKRQEPPKQAGSDAMPGFLRGEQGTLMLKPEQAKISAYFNIDNGSGKLRGIYTQENIAIAPIFEQWAAPLRDLDFTTVTNRNTGGTDHLSFDAVGVPGFQFIQDALDYESQTHHSNMDVYERIQREDVMQASVIVATFLYNAAMRDEMMPRKALPKDTQMEQPKAEPAKESKPAKKK